ncbi:MAG: lipocalin family protein [Bacteroidales bacterium]|nr:lipocalin family protein [Bacteroidales bacterium]
MKKIVFAAVLLLGMGLLFASCDTLSSSSDGKASIVGTWQTIKEEYYQNGKLVRTDNEEDDEAYVTFKESGQMIDADDDVYQYSVKGNTLTVSDKYGTETYVIKRLTSKELVIKTEEYENMYLLAYFRRVSK